MMKKIISGEDLTTYPSSRTLLLVVCLAFLVLVVLGGCSKKHDHPYAPIEHEHELPDHDHPHEHDPVIIEVPVLCGKTDIEVAFTGIIDQSGPNFYLAKVAGFPDELIEENETASTPTEKTYLRSYKGFTGGAISFEKVSGSRAEAIKVELIKQECSD